MEAQRNRSLPHLRRPSYAQHQQGGVEGMAKEQNWPGTLMAIGIFVLVISFWLAGSFTFITYTALGRWFALFAFAGNLLPFKASGLRLGMERLEWFLFNLLAVGPFVFSACLWLNLGVHGPEQLSLLPIEEHAFDVRRYWLENDELPARRPLEEADLKALPLGAGHVLGIADGCLGYPVITRWDRTGE